MSLNCIAKDRSKKAIEIRRLHKESKMRSSLIDRQLREDHKKEFTQIKLLLLGTGESGKTTIMKQMRIIHIDEFSDTEKMEFISSIRQNVRDAIVAIVAAMDKLEIEYETKENEEKGLNLISESLSDSFLYPQEFFDAVEALWKDQGIRTAYQRSSEYQLIDSAEYFLNRISFIRSEDFKPTLQDILRCRKMTDAIKEVSFNIADRKSLVTFRVFDVGGQQGERKKWIQLFDCVTAIVFLVDMSSFDLVLRENQTKNRLVDALEVFHQVWLNKYLRTLPILVFLNKIDLLEAKMRASRSISPMLEYSLASLAFQTDDVSPPSPKYRESVSHDDFRSSIVLADSETKKLQQESQDKVEEEEPTNHRRTMSGSTSFRRRTHQSRSTCRIIVDMPFDTFQATADEEREVIHGFPSTDKAKEGRHFISGHHRSSGKNQPETSLHPETIRTACYIRRIFEELTKQRRSNRERFTGPARKCLYFHTCAVDTDNVQKVLEGCRVFLIEEHLERFGIL